MAPQRDRDKYSESASDDTTSTQSTVAAKSKKEMVGPLEVFRYTTVSDRVMLLIGCVSAFGVGGSVPLFMYFFGQMTTQAYSGSATSAVTNNFGLLMTCIGSLTFVLAFVTNATFLVGASRQVGRMKCAYFAAVLGQDIGWHDDHKPGELISRLTGDTRVIHAGLNDRLSGGVQNSGMGILGFIFAFMSSWELTLLVIGSLPILVVVTSIISRIASRCITETRQQYAVAGAVATEVLENIKTVQTFNRETYESDRFAASVLNSRAAGIKKDFMMSAANGSAMCIMFCVVGCSFIFAKYLIIWGRADAGTVSSAFFSVLYGASGFGAVFPALMSWTESRTAAYPLFQTIDRQPAIDVDAKGKRCVFEKEISFRDVTFAYPTRPDQTVFRNLSVTIRKGEKVAFSGSTGCGKSTIIALLQRFYDPIDGVVEVDGVDVRQFSVKEWRNKIAIVSQEPTLFSGTVLENVRVGKPSASVDEVVLACKRARIHDTIMTLPRGYKTSIGAVGGQLSGGQKQRLAIARAIVRKADLLLLDEATSALDRKSEIEVQKALDDLIEEGNMTVVTIAHRLATIKRMDCIYYLDHEGDGSYIAEYGSYADLIQMNGRFAQMAMMQEPLGTLSRLNSQASFTSNTKGGLVTEELDTLSRNDSLYNDDELGGRLGYGEDDRWSQVSNEKDVPFEHRTEWEQAHTEVTMWRIIKLTKSRTWAIVLGFIGSIGTAIVIPVCGLLISQLIVYFGEYAIDKDEAKLNKGLWLLTPFLFAIGALSFLTYMLTGFYGYVGEHLTYYLRTTLFRQLLRQDQTFFDLPKRGAGSLGGILSGDCEAVHQLYGPVLGSRLKSIFSLLGGVLIGLLFQWKVALVALATMPILVAGMVAQQVFFANKTSPSEKSLDVIVSESLSAIRTINSFNMKDRMILQYKRLVNAEEAVSEKRSALISLIVGFTEFVSNGSVALCFWYGGTLSDSGEADFGQVMVATMAVMMGVSFAGMEAGSFATKMRDARRAARSVFSIIDRVPDIDSYEFGDTNFGEDTCDITFDDVGFVYPARDLVEVLQGVNVHFCNGTSNGLMGQTGCGKSTIVQLLARFYNPSRGVVSVNGHDLASLDIVTWRENISIVLQEPSLFSGTIRENIKYSCPQATDEEMIEAARLACIHDDILKMDNGYDTEVGYRGRELSGGQKQRVAIARGIIKCPRLLLLDEATSALDNATEAAVQENLNAYQKRFDVTIISIAHRLTTIQNADQIVLLDYGRVREQGTHEELIALNGEYKMRWDLTQQ